MKIVASIGGGIAVALVVTVFSLAWVSSPRSSKSATHAASASASTVAALDTDDSRPDDPIPATAATLEPAPDVAEPAPVVSGTPPRVPHPPAIKAGTAPARPASGLKNKPADCVQPFTYDKGVKIPKIHCL